ncbi:hypothetical protein ACHMW6_01300 [Pseudoduganella sp. UC29_106]|uniref:hypothetical protein n=1 Tax=Pseudoduganella sp. UC29_106 TaxID=3374553 RepID=UPI003756D7E0
MFPILTLAITPSTMLDLLNFAAASGSPDRAAELADQAIREWLAAARTPAPPAHRPRGYQWKSLFLPEGTQLRVWSREDGSRYAEVHGDEIIHDGRPLSPNQFVSMMDGIPRNAWTEISLLLPGETAWKPAHVRRDELRRAERALHNPAPPASPSAPSAPVAPAAAAGMPPTPPREAPRAHLAGGRATPEQPHRLPRIPPIDTQARILAANGQTSHWWPGGPERRVDARRAEDAFLD